MFVFIRSFLKLRTLIKLLRLALGSLILAREWVTNPKGVAREAAQQHAVDEQCKQLAIYQFKTCQFCINVRQEMRRLSLPIEQRDAQHDDTHREALLAGGGAVKVPCLLITDDAGQTQWLYDSTAIISYLRGRFA
jgi:glutaredoxin